MIIRLLACSRGSIVRIVIGAESRMHKWALTRVTAAYATDCQSEYRRLVAVLQVADVRIAPGAAEQGGAVRVQFGQGGNCFVDILMRMRFCRPPPSWWRDASPPTHPDPTRDSAPGSRSGGMRARRRSRGSRPACGARGRDSPPHALCRRSRSSCCPCCPLSIAGCAGPATPTAMPTASGCAKRRRSCRLQCAPAQRM